MRQIERTLIVLAKSSELKDLFLHTYTRDKVSGSISNPRWTDYEGAALKFTVLDQAYEIKEKLSAFPLVRTEVKLIEDDKLLEIVPEGWRLITPIRPPRKKFIVKIQDSYFISVWLPEHQYVEVHHDPAYAYQFYDHYLARESSKHYLGAEVIEVF